MARDKGNAPFKPRSQILVSTLEQAVKLVENNNIDSNQVKICIIEEADAIFEKFEDIKKFDQSFKNR
jgi:superfamily II DNA/RNA helicase